MRELLMAMAAALMVCGPGVCQTATDALGDALPERAVQRLGTQKLRYPGDIGDLCYLPDGRGVIALGTRVEIWDLEAGLRQSDVEVTDSGIRSVEASADGTRLLLGDAGGVVSEWEIAGEEVLRRVETGQAGLAAAHYSPDEARVLVTGTGPPTIAEWELATGEQLALIEGRMHTFREAVYGPEGQTAFVDGKAGSGPILAHYDVQTGELLKEWHKDYYAHTRSLELSPDGTRLLAGTRHSAQEWDVETYEMLGKFSGHQGHAVTSVAYCADPDQLLTGSRDGSIRRWNRHDAKVLLRWVPHDGHVTRIEVSPDEEFALSYGAGLVAETRLEDGTPRVVWDRHGGAVVSVAAVPGEERLVSGSTDETVRVWDPVSGESLRLITGADLGAYAVDVSPDGSRLAVGCKDGVVREFSLDDGSLLRALTGHRGYVRAVKYTPAGTHLLSAAGDGVLRAWSMASDQPVHALDDHRGGILAIDVSPDGNFALTGGRDGSVRYWDLRAGRAVRVFPAGGGGHRGWITCVAFMDDGRAVSGGWDGRVIQWDLVVGEAIGEMSVGGRINALVADGQRVYVGAGSDVTCWDLATGEQVAAFSGHADGVTALALTEQGHLVSASEDSTLLVWEQP